MSRELYEMSEKDKKDFLSNDLIERMIRVEQRVSAKFNRLIKYNETAYYKNLGEKKQKEFERYLRHNKRKKYLLTLLTFLAPVIALFAYTPDFTGNVVSENLGEKAILPFQIVIGAVFAVIVISSVIRKLVKSRREKRVSRHFDVIDDWIYGRMDTK